jgi:hypothetical protein
MGFRAKETEPLPRTTEMEVLEQLTLEIVA